MASNIPDISGDTWLNSKPLKSENLKNKVVLVYFWTFDCHNCKAVEPYIKKWHERYADKGLKIIAVHSPEFSHEKKINNVRKYASDHDLRYPIVIDNDFSIWKRYSNRYWPTIYLSNKKGELVYRKIGEGHYITTENRIKNLIAD